MNNVTLLECEIKKLQQEKAEILKLERKQKKKLELEEAISKMSCKNLDGMTKDNAQELVLNTMIELFNTCGDSGASEVFGYNNGLFLPTSLTINDVKNDSFLIDLIILNVGIKLFKNVKIIKGKSDRQAKNITKRLYEKLGNKKIVNYIKENYPPK